MNSSSPPNAEYLNLLREMMSYHNERMQNRRSLGMKTFTGVVILYLVVMNACLEHCCLLTCSIKWLVGSAIVLISLLFLFFMYALEATNKKDRLHYNNINEYLHGVLRGEVRGPIGSPLPESDEQTWFISWAGTWPSFVVIVITIVCLELLCRV